MSKVTLDETGAAVVTESVLDKLQKILARVKRGSTEGEVQAATNLLHQHLKRYNLEMADLELRTGKAKPKVGEAEAEFDNPNARFPWKLDLAESIAEHFFCHPVIDRKAKTVLFVGRPENVDSLKLLYGWLITQIKDLASTERRVHHEKTGEHIDPLRWQLGFGKGAAERIGERLRELKSRFSSDETALVVHHASEISDYTEEKYGYRMDGRDTKRDREWRENYARRQKEQADLKAECEARGNMEPYYEKYPYTRPKPPETEAEKAARIKQERKIYQKWERADARRAEAERRRERNPEEQTRREQVRRATNVGTAAADRINLTPFIEGAVDDKKKVKS